MSLTPRNTLDDDYLNGISCAICGNPNLKITHVEKYPDFVSCNQCGAAFVVESEGSWVMYGKIPAEYPQTSQFALRQWTWLDAVAQRAADEREMRSAPSHEPQETVQEIQVTPTEIQEYAQPFVDPTPPDQAEAPKPVEVQAEFEKRELSEDQAHTPPFSEEIEILGDEDLQSSTSDETVASITDEFPLPEDDLVPSPVEPIDTTSVRGEERSFQIEDELFPEIEHLDDTVEETLSEQPDSSTLFPEEVPYDQELITSFQEPIRPKIEEEKPEVKPSSVPIGEPEPDKRFRVTIRGSQPKYPKNYCAHCLRTPVKLKAIMRGSLPDPNQPGKRKLVPLDLPFCRDCQKRMNAQSEEERNAKLLAFLVSGIIALIAIIVTFALGIINFGENLVAGLIIMMIVAILGFTVPLLVGLTLAGRYPPPRDAAFVLSTLLVNESGEDLTEFEWRNPGYAELFRQVNQENTLGEVTPIQDRVTFTEIPPGKTQDKKERPPKSKPSKKPTQENVIETDSQKEP